jgi:hypothetical protein
MNVDASNASDVAVDKFGIRMIYPTNTSSDAPKAWFLDDDWKERAFEWEDDDVEISEQPINNTAVGLNIDSHNTDPSGQIRFPVLSINDTSHLDNLELSQEVLRDRGFMGTPQDWKNVEVTFYAKVNEARGSVNGKQHFEILTRGGPTHSSTRGDPCEGVSLHTNLYQDPIGRVKLEKELSHTDGYATDEFDKEGVTTSLMDRWIGMKGVFYNTPEGNVQIELWLDKNANNDWGTEPVLTKLDNGGWFIKDDDIDNECEGENDEIVKWGGPVAIFRWDNFQDVDFKWASIREIVAPQRNNVTVDESRTG